jgi:hypothetical protein
LLPAASGHDTTREGGGEDPNKTTANTSESLLI